MIGPGYQGTLGCGFATALGAQVGNPGKKVVAVSGDGGFMYNVQELATMKHYNIPLVAIVFNDNAFGNVKRIQQRELPGPHNRLRPDQSRFRRVSELLRYRRDARQRRRTPCREPSAKRSPPMGPS